jgi:hypothetical protein
MHVTTTLYRVTLEAPKAIEHLFGDNGVSRDIEAEDTTSAEQIALTDYPGWTITHVEEVG